MSAQAAADLANLERIRQMLLADRSRLRTGLWIPYETAALGAVDRAFEPLLVAIDHAMDAIRDDAETAKLHGSYLAMREGLDAMNVTVTRLGEAPRTMTAGEWEAERRAESAGDASDAAELPERDR